MVRTTHGNQYLYWNSTNDLQYRRSYRINIALPDPWQGLKLRPIQSHFRLNFLPLPLKYLEKSQICDLKFHLRSFETKGLAVATFLLLLLKYRNEKIILFIAVKFLRCYVHNSIYPIIRHFQRFLYTQVLRDHILCFVKPLTPQCSPTLFGFTFAPKSTVKARSYDNQS